MSSTEVPELPARTSPVLVMRWLGDVLEGLRVDAGLTQRAAANAMGWGVGKVGYIESGERPISLSDLVDQVFRTYRVPEERRARLIELAEAANAKAWWDGYDEQDLGRHQKRFIGYEHGARSLRSFETVLVPGLLQTAEYAEAAIRAGGIPRATERVAKLVGIRRRRQDVLAGDDPLRLWAVLDEAVLRRRALPDELMAAQLNHVADLAESRDNVVVQVIPFDAGLHAAGHGSFSIFDFPWPDDPGLVYLESGPTETRYLETRSEVYAHSQVFDQLTQVALGADQAIAMLRNTASEYRAKAGSR